MRAGFSVSWMLAAGLAWGGAGVAAAQDELDTCGELVQGVECVLFETDGGALYVLDDAGPFEVGDRVRVTGQVDPDCVTICQQGDGCVAVDEIVYCDGAVAICGELVEGVTCTLLEDDKGFVFAIEELGDFEVGDRVYVQGTLDTNCVSICQEIDGCIRDNTIRDGAEGDCDAAGPPACEIASLLLTLLTGAGLVRTWPRRGRETGA